MDDLPTGYEFDFVDPLSPERECAICRHALRNPVQLTSCGHRYCKNCLKTLVEESSSDPKCPQDREPIPAEREWFHDQACEREIHSLRVKCKKNKEGCDWIGELCHYYQSKHIDVCPCEAVTCEDCDTRMERRFLNTHTTSKCDCRIVECEYCEEKLEFWERPGHLDIACPRFPVKCPQRCGMVVPRNEMEFHEKAKCMMTTVFCPYKEAGCTFHDKRSNLGTHLEASKDEHLREVLSKLSETTKQLKQRETEIKSLKKKVKKQDDQVAEMQVENASMEIRLSHLEEGTEKTRELSKRVNQLEKETQKYGEMVTKHETEIKSLKEKVENQEDKVQALEIENASMKIRLSQSEEGTEETRELSRRVNDLEKVQGQLEKLQQETESATKTRVKESEVVKKVAKFSLTWPKEMQLLMKKQDVQIRRLNEERERETYSLKRRVEQLERQDDKSVILMREELKQFMDKVVRKFETTLEKQRLNPATSPVNSTNQLPMQRNREIKRKKCLAAQRTHGAFDPVYGDDSDDDDDDDDDIPLLVKKRRKRNRLAILRSEHFPANGQPKKTISCRPTERKETMDAEEDYDGFYPSEEDF